MTKLAWQHDLAIWRVAERHFAAKHYDGAAVCSANSCVLTLPGDTGKTVFFTAPHAVNHWRAGRIKLADRGTGGLAVALHHRAGTGALVTKGSGFGDAAFDDSHPLKDLLRAIRPRPLAVIDLHGMAEQDQHTDVVVGTSLDARFGTPLAEMAETALGSRGIVVGTDRRFNACRRTTVTDFAHHLGIPAIQMEIAPNLRPPLWEKHRAAMLFDGLATLAFALGRSNVPPIVGEPVRRGHQGRWGE